jgi:transcriptional regulator with XRE-family HTH domain
MVLLKKRETMKRGYPRLIGKKLHELRKKSAFTQEELADRANLNRNCYGRIERSEINVTIDILVSIAEAKQVELVDVFDLAVRADGMNPRNEVVALLRKQKLTLLLSIRNLRENIKVQSRRPLCHPHKFFLGLVSLIFISR